MQLCSHQQIAVSEDQSGHTADLLAKYGQTGGCRTWSKWIWQKNVAISKEEQQEYEDGVFETSTHGRVIERRFHSTAEWSDRKVSRLCRYVP